MTYQFNRTYPFKINIFYIKFFKFDFPANIYQQRIRKRSVLYLNNSWGFFPSQLLRLHRLYESAKS